jgi:para-nitrobenzyl esterase
MGAVHQRPPGRARVGWPVPPGHRPEWLCLDRPPVQDLFAHAQPFQPYGFGNQALPEVPAQPLRDGRFHQVPVLSGATRDEHRLFVGLFRVLAGQPVTAEQYPELLAEAFGEHADRV